MMNFEALEEYDINQFEYCFNLSDNGYWVDYFLINIPKLMPLIPRAKPATTNIVIDNNIFVNASDCKPTTSSTITTQNYLTLPRFWNTDFRHKKDANDNIPEGERFLCCIVDKNIRDIHLTDYL
jgi:hypothetical protein